MSMPQHFQVVVIQWSSLLGGEIAGAATTLLRAPEQAFHPYIVAAATHGSCRLALSEALASRGLILWRPVPPYFFDPRSVDLWLALDETAESFARRRIEESGPAPRGFYRNVFPDPVQRLGTTIADPPGSERLGEWLDELQSVIEPWRERIWNAFYDSS
jgi:hypothetical protein